MNHPYVLPQQLLTWTDGKNIQIGISQEHARTIAGVDGFMIDFLRSANIPKSLDEHIKQLQMLSREDEELCANVVESSVNEGIIRRKTTEPNDRYSRHDLYYALTYGSEYRSSNLSDKKIAIIGVGGIGSNLATILCTAGVGELLLVDDDSVERTNLTRQYLFKENDIGNRKVDVAKVSLEEKNPNVVIRTLQTQVDSKKSLADIFEEVDLSVISADSSSKIMSMANEAAVETGKPFMPAGYQDTVGVVGPFFVPSDRNSTCLTCAQRTVHNNDDYSMDASKLEDYEVLTASYQAPSFGPLNLMVAATSANEVIRYLLTGSSKLINSRANLMLSKVEVEIEEYKRDKNCPDCANRKCD